MHNNSKRGLVFTAVVVLACLSFIPVASASVIGTVNEANCTGGNAGVTVSATNITWFPATSGTTGCISVGSGNLTYNSGTLLTVGTTGNILDLTLNPANPPVDDFMVFTIGSTTIDFKLLALGPGSANTNCSGLAIGGTCSVPLLVGVSPFLLTYDGGSTTSVTLAASGQVTDNGGVSWSNWAGAFTTQISTATPAQIAAAITGGGSVTSTQSGSFTASTIPEPGSMTLLGAGLIAIAIAARKRRKA